MLPVPSRERAGVAGVVLVDAVRSMALTPLFDRSRRLGWKVTRDSMDCCDETYEFFIFETE